MNLPGATVSSVTVQERDSCEVAVCTVTSILSPLLCSAIVRRMVHLRAEVMRDTLRESDSRASNLSLPHWKEPELSKHSLLGGMEIPHQRSQACNRIGTVLPLSMSPQCAHDDGLAGNTRKISEFCSALCVTTTATPVLAGLCHSPG